jgi:hypothetical protein
MTNDEYPSKEEILKTIFDVVYAQYPKKEWQGLSDSVVMKIVWDLEHITDKDLFVVEYYRAIEQELKTKNGFSGLKDKNA